MPLDQQNQISLLIDILKNHQLDCCGSITELQQLERIIKALMVKMDISDHEDHILEQIYSYSQGGINSHDVDHHIESHQEKLSQWVEQMNQFT